MKSCFDNFTAIVLAAGYSSRMGAFKPLLPLGGKPALARLLGSITAAGIRDIVVVTGHRRGEIGRVISEYRAGGSSARTVYNEDYASGMFSSVRAGLSAALDTGSASENGGPDGVLIFPVDTPMVSSKTIDSLVSEYAELVKSARHTAARRVAEAVSASCYLVPTFLGKKGHPLLLPANIIPSIISYKGDGGLKSALAALVPLGAEMRLIETDDEGAVLDMDVPEDYEDMLLLAEFAKRGQAAAPVTRDSFEKYDRVFLVRHGEIRQHSGKILLGQTDVPLSDAGREEAAAAAEKLAALGVHGGARIIASDLLRTTETAQIIAQRLDKSLSSIELYSGLREIDLGDWDGRMKDDVEKEFPREYAARGEDIIPWKASGGENYYDVRYRVLRTLRRILMGGARAEVDAGDMRREDAGEPLRDLIIVTHAGPIRTINSAFTDTPLAELMAWRAPRCVPLHLDGSPW
ncbi:MAG: histidine phosphatase family protein [Clostridiales Family XIII bacterium]|jgi:broad specificity phosphatase PhoE/CTP:molybdopterin cytidylyltransferase MocA|nr:histidine phosphatase family protein [Clostridiales Family XIII bacterium]